MDSDGVCDCLVRLGFRMGSSLLVDREPGQKVFVGGIPQEMGQACAPETCGQVSPLGVRFPAQILRSLICWGVLSV